MQFNKPKLRCLRWLSTKLFPICFWLSLMYAFDKVYAAHLAILAAIIHESGHITAALLKRTNVSRPRGHLTGLRILCTGISSYPSEIFVLVGGPLFNLIFFLIFLGISRGNIGYSLDFAQINLATAISNLLPVRGFDGHSIAKRIAEFRGNDTALRVINSISLSFVCSMCFLTLYLIYRFNGGYWLFAIFFSSLLAEIGKSTKKCIFRE